MTFNEVIFGTSPFLFAKQFGHRSRLYELDFQRQPENVAKILDKAYSMGVDTLMLQKSDELECAIDISIANGSKWRCVGFTTIENFDYSMELFAKYDTSCVIVDGFFVDDNLKEGNFDEIIKYLRLIKDAGFTAGIETRMPFTHLDLIANSELMDYFDVLMFPLNFYGYMMDCNFLNNDNKALIKNLIGKFSDKKIVANRTLAAGVLMPSEAYNFIKDIDYLDCVCVGMAKISEVEETMEVINSVKS